MEIVCGFVFADVIFRRRDIKAGNTSAFAGYPGMHSLLPKRQRINSPENMWFVKGNKHIERIRSINYVSVAIKKPLHCQVITDIDATVPFNKHHCQALGNKPI